jgi:hypothetical protein
LFDVAFIPKNFTIAELENEFQNLMTSVYSDDLVAKRKMIFKQTLLNKKQAGHKLIS